MPQDATLPIATPPFMPGQVPGQGQDPQMAMFLKLLQSLGGPQGGQQPQPEQSQVTPARPGVAMPPSAPATMQTKFDPMSNVGSLPVPHEMPLKQGANPSPTSNELMSKLEPQGAAIFSGLQGITGFIQDTFQKKDQEKHVEAANAAQALMSALESAKTTGDYRPAEHILENNEQLFNKVYKGWLQQAEEAKKPKKEKKSDPEVEGFEKGLASYLGTGAAKQAGQPQPPSTLQGKSGAKYFMPQAAPGQALQQQAQSGAMQAQRQGQEVITPEERVKLQEANVRLQELQVNLQRAHVELQKAQTEATKSGTDFAAQRTLFEDRMALANDKFQKALFEKDAQMDVLRVKIANKQGGPSGHKLTEADSRKMSAVSQTSAYLDDMISKAKPFRPNDISALQGMLATAGASSVAKELPKSLWSSWTGKPEDVSKFKTNFDNYVVSLKAGIDRAKPKSSGGGVSVVSGAQPIVISPEDMKN